jgi:hypothetical protein
VGHGVILSVIQTNGHAKETTRSPSPMITQLLEMIRAGGDVDVVRESVELVLQALIDAEATEVIGAGLHERTDSRTNQRNGSRPAAFLASGHRPVLVSRRWADTPGTGLRVCSRRSDSPSGPRDIDAPAVSNRTGGPREFAATRARAPRRDGPGGNTAGTQSAGSVCASRSPARVLACRSEVKMPVQAAGSSRWRVTS